MASDTSEPPSSELPQVDAETRTKYLMVFVDFLFGDQSKTVTPNLIRYFEIEPHWLDELEKRRLISRRTSGPEQVEISVTPLGKLVASVQKRRMHNEQRAAGEVVLASDAAPTLVEEMLHWIICHRTATALLGTAASVVLVVAGLILVYLGATGRFSWTAHLTGLANQILDLFVGAALIGAGLFLGWAARFALRTVAPLEAPQTSLGPS